MGFLTLVISFLRHINSFFDVLIQCEAERNQLSLR
ncbi:hypothetical protein PMIT1320_02605 [Prochlorococcus marinus str. MIT 1320]|nr:hypothetical protein PMIT1320_02605 [Prochlorococcus marinus str. MIT 1320]